MFEKNENLNIDNIVESSFIKFLIDNDISYPNLTSDLLRKFNLDKFLQENKLNSLENIENVKNILNLQNLSEIGEIPKIYKFFGTIKNIFINQIYLGARYDKISNKYLNNKFYEQKVTMIEDDEDYFSNKHDFIFCDIEKIELIPIKGLNEFISKDFDYDKINNKKIIVYNYDKTNSKINDNILILGTAYKTEEGVIFHSWKVFHNFEKEISKIKLNLNNIDINNLVTQSNLKIKKIFENIFKGDKIASDYMTLFLFSQFLMKENLLNIGYFPLNIILPKNQTESNEQLTKNLNFILKKICMKLKSINFDKETLDQTNFFPIYNIETEEIKGGEMQLSDHTFLVINEQNMKAGKLTINATKNLETIKNILDNQKLKYEIPYNPIEMKQENEILIITYFSKSLLGGSELVNFLPIIFDPNFKIDIDLNTENYLELFLYVNYFRYNTDFSENFFIDKEIGDKIAHHFSTSDRTKYTDCEFTLTFQLSRLYAISNGRNRLQYEDYIFIYNLEMERLKRIEMYKEKKRSDK